MTGVVRGEDITVVIIRPTPIMVTNIFLPNLRCLSQLVPDYRLPVPQLLPLSVLLRDQILGSPNLSCDRIQGLSLDSIT